MNHLGVFAKYWQPGTVKTRLAKSIGPEKAAGLYRDFVELTLQRLSQTADSRSIWCWPPDRESDFKQTVSSAWQVHIQASGDLGNKMQGFFESTLANHSRAVLIGSDTPNLPIRLVEQALVVLDSVDIVFGPSEDGGYYLIGLRKNAFEVFRKMTWSTSQVLDESILRAQAAGHSFSLLEPWRDIDTIDDLKWLHQQCSRDENADPSSQTLLPKIRRALQGSSAELTEIDIPNRDRQS